jgi:diguanylate cyclase (GGDEF)-like protein
MAVPNITLGPEALNRMMPMHVLIAPDGTILNAGPTLAKVHAGQTLAGRAFSDVFEQRRSGTGLAVRDVCTAPLGKVHLRLRDPARTPVIGAAYCLGADTGVLVNLSFGIAVVDAVARFGLAGSDFAATDLTVEMLYLVEAKSAAMAESRHLNERLDGARAQAEADALADTLTGLANRRALDQALARLIGRGAPFTLMRIDLDHFKAVNDTFGHEAGDRVLSAVADVLGGETRDGDIAARVGGDEFVLVFVGLTDPHRLEAISTRLIRRIEKPVLYQGQCLTVSASVGLVGTPHYDAPDAERMLRDADVALYVSKSEGRGRATTYREPRRNDFGAGSGSLPSS